MARPVAGPAGRALVGRYTEAYAELDRAKNELAVAARRAQRCGAPGPMLPVDVLLLLILDALAGRDDVTEDADPAVAPTTQNLMARSRYSQSYVDNRLGQLRRAGLVSSAYGQKKGWRHVYLHALTGPGRGLLRALFPPQR